MGSCYFPFFICWQFLVRVASRESYAWEKVNLLLRKKFIFWAIKRPIFKKINKSDKGRKSPNWVCNSRILHSIQCFCSWHLIESVPFQMICENFPLSFSQSYFPFSVHANPLATATMQEKHISLCPRYFPQLHLLCRGHLFSKVHLSETNETFFKESLNYSSHQHPQPID